MSRLKYTRKRSNMIRVSNATRYFSNSNGRSVVPDVFRYFFDLHVFTPWNWLDVDDLARLLSKGPATALKNIRKLQDAYGLPYFNYVTVKDLCEFYQYDMGSIQRYFYYVDWMDFKKRCDNLKHK
jgi:hypothetical protein